MNDALKTVRKNGYAVVVKYYECPENPREWDNLGKLFLQARSVHVTECTEDEMKEARVKVPVYMYKHGGVILKASTDGNPFSCPWDSGLVGYIVASAEDIRRNYGVKRITKRIVDSVVAALISEIETYGQYVAGEVYGFETYRVTDDVPDSRVCEDGELVDSCWGYYDINGIEDYALDNIPKKDAVMA